MEYGFRYPIAQSGAAGLEISRGTIDGLRHVNKFGEQPDVNGTREDVWGGNGIWSAPTSAQIHEVFSNSPNDTLAGTGMQKVMLEGLDANGDEISEEVDLSGATPVDTTNSFIMVNRMYGTQWGSVGYNQGPVSARAKTDGTNTCRIMTSSVYGGGYNQSTQAIYMIPAGYRAYLNQWTVGSSRGNNAYISGYLLYRPPGVEGWRLQSALDVSMGVAGRSYAPPPVYEPLGILKVSVTASQTNTSCFAEFDLVLERI